MWCPWPNERPQPGKRQLRSRCLRARRSAGGMVRVRAPTSVTRPSASWRITTRVAPHASRRDVSAETWAPSSRADCPGASGSAGTSVSARTGASTDDDLVPLAGWPRIDPVMEDRLGEQGQRVGLPLAERRRFLDRKSTRLNSSHLGISYAVFCLKKKKKKHTDEETT